MSSNKHKGTFSLQQVLDSILNNDTKNYVSVEKVSEEEFDYNNIVTENEQSMQFSNINIAPTKPQLFTLLLWSHILFLQQQTMVM